MGDSGERIIYMEFLHSILTHLLSSSPLFESVSHLKNVDKDVSVIRRIYLTLIELSRLHGCKRNR